MLSKKQYYGKEFFHLISSIKKSINKGHEMLFFKKIGSHSEILQLLFNEGFIVSFQEHKKFLVVRLKTVFSAGANNKRFSNIEQASRVGRKNYTISLKELMSLQRREGGTTYYILNTDKGLLTSFAAIEKCVGGKILLKIF